MSIITLSTQISFMPIYNQTPALPPGPGNHWSDFCPYNFAFSRRLEIIWYAVFSIWILLLRIMYLRSMHVAKYINTLFLFNESVLLDGCATTCLLIHQLVNIFFPSFLVIMIKADINNNVEVFDLIYVFITSGKNT